MKIYNDFSHKFKIKNKIDLDTDLPLYYINIESESKNITIKHSKNFIGDNKKLPMIPYYINKKHPYHLNGYYINKNNERLDNNKILQRYKGNEYYYIPEDTRSFIPEIFSYSLLIKKSIKYKTNKIFNIKAGCIDNKDLIFSNKLIKIFGDLPKRKDKIIPNNIYINNGDMSPESLINSNFQDNDFIFIESIDGKHYYDYETKSNSKTEINIDYYINNNINLWITSENFSITDGIVETNDNLLFNNKTFQCKHIIENNIENEDNILFKDNSPVVIKHIKNKGYIVYSHKKFLDNIIENVKLFYTILFYIYSNGYKKSEEISTWIADEIPDYIIENNNLYTNNQKNFSILNDYNKLFELEKNEITIKDIIINDDNIGIRYMKDTDDVIFYKKHKNDIVKKEGEKSIYLESRKIIYFKEFAYEINDNLINNSIINDLNPSTTNDKISFYIKDNIFYLSIEPFINSYHNIFIDKNILLSYELYEVLNYEKIIKEKVDLFLVCKNNILKLINQKNFSENNGTIILEINIAPSNKVHKFYDIRKQGGGTKKYIGNNELLNVGNIKGRPYRKNNTLIITLPKKYENYKDYLYEALYKHTIAEDYIILLFE